MLLPKFLSRKISPEKSLDFLSQKSVVRPALDGTLKISRNIFMSKSEISRHIYSNSCVLLNFPTNECFTITDLPRKRVSPPFWYPPFYFWGVWGVPFYSLYICVCQPRTVHSEGTETRPDYLVNHGQQKWGAMRGKKFHINREIIVQWLVGVVGAHGQLQECAKRATSVLNKKRESSL